MTPSHTDKSETEKASLARRLTDVEIELVARENRSAFVLVNLLQALRPQGPLQGSSRRAAFLAFARWLFTGTPLIVTVSLGGVATALLALQANLLFLEQNGKIDLQNRLQVVQFNQAEEAKHEQRMDKIAAYLSEVRSEKVETSSGPATLSPILEERLYTLTASLQPYRAVIGDELFRPSTLKDRLGLLARLLPERWSRLSDDDQVWIPKLSPRRLSPERGRASKGTSSRRSLGER